MKPYVNHAEKFKKTIDLHRFFHYFGAPTTTKLAPSWLTLAQINPKLVTSWTQVGPKLAPSWLKLGPSWPQVGPKMAQVASGWPKLAQIGLKLAQAGPKLA